jgi:hypothetical protein
VAEIVEVNDRLPSAAGDWAGLGGGDQAGTRADEIDEPGGCKRGKSSTCKNSVRWMAMI